VDNFSFVIPAKAGIQDAASAAQKELYRAHGALLDTRLRGYDDIYGVRG